MQGAAAAAATPITFNILLYCKLIRYVYIALSLQQTATTTSGCCQSPPELPCKVRPPRAGPHERVQPAEYASNALYPGSKKPTLAVFGYTAVLGTTAITDLILQVSPVCLLVGFESTVLVSCA